MITQNKSGNISPKDSISSNPEFFIFGVNKNFVAPGPNFIKLFTSARFAQFQKM